MLLAGIQVAQYEDKFIDFFRRTMTQLKTVRFPLENALLKLILIE